MSKSKPDLYLLAALAALEVIDVDKAEAIIRLYDNHDFDRLVPTDLHSAMHQVIDAFIEDDELREMVNEIATPGERDLETDSPVPPAWWLLAYKGWDEFIEDDCRE